MSIRDEILGNEIIPLGWKINYIANYYSLVGNRRLVAQHGITRQEFVVLFCLANCKQVTAQEVCEVTARPKNTISRAVNKLLKMGLIRRTSHPNDSRAELIYMEPEGAELYQKIIKVFKARDQAMTAGLSAAELKTLDRLLYKVISYFNPWTEGD